MEASFGDNVNLDSRVAPRVVDGACVDLGDRHDNCPLVRLILEPVMS